MTRLMNPKRLVCESSVKTDVPYKYALLHIPTGEIVYECYTRAFVEEQMKLTKKYRAEFEIIPCEMSLAIPIESQSGRARKGVTKYA